MASDKTNDQRLVCFQLQQQRRDFFLKYLEMLLLSIAFGKRSVFQSYAGDYNKEWVAQIQIVPLSGEFITNYSNGGKAHSGVTKEKYRDLFSLEPDNAIDNCVAEHPKIRNWFRIQKQFWKE